MTPRRKSRTAVRRRDDAFTGQVVPVPPQTRTDRCSPSPSTVVRCSLDSIPRALRSARDRGAHGRQNGGMGGKSRLSREPSLRSDQRLPARLRGPCHRAGWPPPYRPDGMAMRSEKGKGKCCQNPSSDWQLAPTSCQPAHRALHVPVSEKAPFTPYRTNRFDGRSLLSFSINNNSGGFLRNSAPRQPGRRTQCDG